MPQHELTPQEVAFVTGDPNVQLDMSAGRVANPIPPQAGVPQEPSPAPQAAPLEPGQPVDDGNDDPNEAGDFESFFSPGPQDDQSTNDDQTQSQPVLSDDDITEVASDDDYDFTEDAYDVRNYLPEEVLESEFAFDLDERAKYRDYEALKKGTKARLQYLDEVITERDGAKSANEAKDTEIADLRTQLEVTKAVYSNGLSEEENERRIAKQYLPEEMQVIDPATFDVSLTDYLPDWESFLSDYSKRHAPKRDDFDDDFDYREARLNFQEKARGEFGKKQSKAQNEYQARIADVESVRHQYEHAMADAIARVRSERQTQIANAQNARESQARRIRDAETKLKKEVSPKRLGVSNAEDEKTVGEIPRQQVVMYSGGDERELSMPEAMILIEAQFGSDVTGLIVDGIKARVIGDKSSAPNRPRPKTPGSGMRKIARGGQRRRAAPTQPATSSLEEEFAEAGYVAG